ncbi:hypothetical protein D3C81_2175240 [compost metagenome]
MSISFSTFCAVSRSAMGAEMDGIIATSASSPLKPAAVSASFTERKSAKVVYTSTEPSSSATTSSAPASSAASIRASSFTPGA